MLVEIFALLLWRLLVGFVVMVLDAAKSVRNNQMLAVFIVALYISGIPLQNFPEEIQTVSDEVYECGILRSAEVTSSVTGYILRGPYEYVAFRWNTAILFVMDAYDDVYGALKALQLAGKVSSVTQGGRVIGEALLGGNFEDFSNIMRNILTAIGDYLVGLADAFFDGLDFLASFVATWFIRVNMFSGSCSLCSADPGPRECILRSPLLPGQSEFDCDECHELTVQLGRVVGGNIDAATASFLALLGTGTSFARIGGSITGLSRAFIMYPIHVISALVENPDCRAILDIINIADPTSEVSRWWLAGDPLIYNGCSGTLTTTIIGRTDPVTFAAICCGKPSGCTFPKDGGLDHPIGILPCFGEVIRALTGDKIDDFFELVLEFLLPIVNMVVKTVSRIIECAQEPTYLECLERYPTTGVPGVDAGVCFYDDDDIVPEGGVHQCFQIQFACILDDVANKAPLLEPVWVVGGVFDFLLDEFWQFSIDIAVCAVSTAPFCFDGTLAGPVTNLSTAIVSFECLVNNNPLLGPVIGAPIVFVLEGVELLLGPIEATIAGFQATLTSLQNTVAGFSAFKAKVDKFLKCVERCGASLTSVFKLNCCFDGGSAGGCGCDEAYAGADEPAGPRWSALRSTKKRRTTDVGAAMDADVWNQVVWNHTAMPVSGLCGRLVYETGSTVSLLTDSGTDVLRTMCMAVYNARFGLARGCGLIAENGTAAASLVDDDEARALFDGLTGGGGGDDDEEEEGDFVRGVIAMLLSPRCRGAAAAAAAQNDENVGGGGSGGLPFPKIDGMSFVPNFARNINASSWQLMPDFVYPLIDNIKRTSVFGRTREFYDVYLDRMARAVPQAQLDELYVGWANDVLSLYRTGEWRNATPTVAADEGGLLVSYIGKDGRAYHDVSVASLRAGADRFWESFAALHLVDSAEQGRAVGLWGLEPANALDDNATTALRPLALGGKRPAFALSPINEETQLGWWPAFARTAGVVRALRARDGTALMALLRGRVQYRVDTDTIVSLAEFARLQPAAARIRSADQPVPTLLTVGLKAAADAAGVPLPFAVWESRRERAYAPFPVPLYPTDDPRSEAPPSWVPGAMRFAQAQHDRYSAKRQAKFAAGATPMQARRQSAEADFDANAIVTSWLDAIVQFFSGDLDATPFATVQNNTIAFWEGFDLQNYTAENVTQTLRDFFKCTVPLNINGTGARSPMCILLMYEDALSTFSPVTGTSGSFPMQIPWPEALVTRACTSVYNGVPDLLDFVFTNNCLLPLPPDADTQTCVPEPANASCTGTATLTMDPAVQATQDVIEYTVAQSLTGDSDATCAITQVALYYPAGCASVLNVTGACVTGFATDATPPSAAEACAPALAASGSSGVLTVDLGGNVLGGTCVFRVHYSIGVVPSTGLTPVHLTGDGQAACAACSLRLPSVTCQASDAPPNDLFRDLRPLCTDCVDPFCPGCGYCAREYQSCGAAGFADAADSLFYLTGVAPFALDEMLFGGLDVKTFEVWYGAPVVVILFIALLPFMLVCIGFPLWIVAINAAHMLPWTFHIFFDDIIPWPIIFSGFAVYMQLRHAPWWEMFFWVPLLATFPGVPFGMRVLLLVLSVASQSPRAKELLKPFFAAIHIMFVLWAVTLAFETPTFSESLDVNAALGDLLLFLDSSLIFVYVTVAFSVLAAFAFLIGLGFVVFGGIAYAVIALFGFAVFGGIAAAFWWLAFFVDFTALSARLDEFKYENADDVPDVATFCFWWSWQNLALIGAAGVLVPSVARFVYRGVAAAILWVIAMTLFVFSVFVTSRQAQVHARVRANSRQIGRNNSLITRAYARLRRDAQRKTNAVAARLGLGFLLPAAASKQQRRGGGGAGAAVQQQQQRARPHDSGPDSGAAAVPAAYAPSNASTVQRRRAADTGRLAPDDDIFS
jgi:hypothetical protein